jgi:Type VI secretion system (T6SS), amidase effector protein 4
MFRSLPSFTTLATNFPDHLKFPTKKLLDTIGGQVRANLGDAINTCAIRLSYALNKSGAPIRPTAGVHFKGAPHVLESTARHASPSLVSDLYVFRVADMKRYLVGRYGAGTLIYDGRHPDEFAVPFRHPAQGIIIFEWVGRWADFNASGHADLFRVILGDGKPPTLIPACVGNCYWMPGPMLAYLWELRQ